MNMGITANIDDLVLAKKVILNRGIKPGTGNALIVNEAMNRGLSVSGTPSGKALLSRGSGRSFYWRNGVSNINHKLARKIVPQKEVTSRILRASGTRGSESVVFGSHDVERAWAWGQYALPLVVKPFNASQGRGVHIGIESKESFVRAFEAVAHNYGDVLVENFISGTEHRALVVDNVLVAVTRREPAHIIGDGINSIEMLIGIKNRKRGPIHKELKVDENVHKYLNIMGHTIDSIPGDGQKINLRKTSNLHTGGDAVDATDELSQGERVCVERAAKALPGLRVAGFDVLLPRDPADEAPAILEVNPFPMISMHHFPIAGHARDVAGPIVRAMFPPT
jgi:D-alanine-D-alanine ligase-like ATP-grasp enzyme